MQCLKKGTCHVHQVMSVHVVRHISVGPAYWGILIKSHVQCCAAIHDNLCVVSTVVYQTNYCKFRHSVAGVGGWIVKNLLLASLETEFDLAYTGFVHSPWPWCSKACYSTAEYRKTKRRERKPNKLWATAASGTVVQRP
jgi:hypothetical protein